MKADTQGGTSQLFIDRTVGNPKGLRWRVRRYGKKGSWGFAIDVYTYGVWMQCAGNFTNARTARQIAEFARGPQILEVG